MTVRITDFDRGLGYGLLVAVAGSVGAYWFGQDHAPDQPIVSVVVTPDGYDVRIITPIDEDGTIDEALDSIVTERSDAGYTDVDGDGEVVCCAERM